MSDETDQPGAPDGTPEPGIRTPESRPPRRRLWRRLLKWGVLGGLAGLLVLFLLVLALPLITNTGIVRGRVAAALSAFLNDAEVGLRTLRVAPAGRRVLLLEGLSIAPAGEPDSPVVRVGTVRCTWSRSALLGGHILLPSLSAEDVRADLRRRDGAWNVQDIMPVSEEPLRLEELLLPLPVDVESIRIRDVALSVSGGEKLSAELSGISVDGSAALRGNLLGRGTFDMTIAEAAARFATVRAEAGQPVHALLGFWREGEPALCTAGAWMEGGVLSADGLGQVGPLSGSAGIGVEVNLKELAVPRADGWAALPGVMADRFGFSLAGGPEYRVEGENRFWLDPAALLAAVRSDRLPAVELTGALAAESTLSGSVRPARPEVDLHFAQTVAGWGLGAAFELEEQGIGADLRGADLVARQWGGAHVGEALFGMTALAGGGRLEGAGFGFRGAAGSVADARGTLSLEAALPVADVLSLSADLSAGRLGAQAPAFGAVDVPAWAGLRLEAREPSRPRRARLRLAELSGGLGTLAPGFRMEVAADLRPGALAANGSGALDVAEALGLLPDAVRPIPLVSGAVGGRLELAGRLTEGLALEVAGKADLPRAELAAAGAQASIRGLDASADLSARVDAAFLPYAVASRAQMGLANLEARLADDAGGRAVSVSVEGLDVAMDARLPGGREAELAAGLAASARGLGAALETSEGGRKALGPLAMDAHARLAATPLVGDLALSDVRLSVTDVLTVRAPRLALRGLGADGLEGGFSLEVPELADLPATLADVLPQVAGTVRAEGEVMGRAPVVDKLLAAAAGAEMRPLEPFPLDAFYAEDVPLDARGRLTVDGLSLAHALPSGTAMGVEAAELRSELALQDGQVTASLDARVPEVEFPPSPVPLRDFALSSRARLSDFDRFELEEFRFRGPSELVQMDASGRIAGLGRLRGVPTAGSLLSGLDVALRSEGAVRPGGLLLPEDWAAEGGLGWRTELDLEAGRRLAVRVLPRLDGLAVRLGDLLAVSGLAGTLGLEKSWSIRTAEAEPPALSQELIATEAPPTAEGTGGLAPDFGTAAGELAATDAGLTLDSASALGRRLVEAVRAELVGRDSRLLVPQFSLKPLGGTLVGRLSFTPAAEGRELRLDGEFDGIDFSAMLPPELRDLRGDSTVAGSFAVQAVLAEALDTEHNPIKDVSGRLDVTHVGSDALGRALLALDPAGERPAFVRLRSALKLAGPRRVEVRLERGFVSAQVELQGAAGGLISSYSLPRFSIAQLLSSDLVRRGFGRAAMLGRALHALDADVLEIEADGSVRLVRDEKAR